jgi:proline dehydrogenase
MRKVLLWLARNAWLRERLPRLPFMQRAVRRFMPGEDVEDALHAAVDLQVLGIGTLYTRLGENLTEIGQAQAVADHYLGLLERIQAAEIEGEISVKPTQLGLDVDEDACFELLRTLAAAAEAQGSCLWIDMEDSSYVDRTLDLYQRLRASHPRTGICLQAYLRRTAKDVERLLPIAPRSARWGAYDEPWVAFRSKKEVDANFLGIAVTLLRESRTRSIRLGLGTHDVELVEQIASHAAAAGIGKGAFEVQMLYGIRAKEQRRLARNGYRVQVLIAYGAAWYPWYMRRLAERPPTSCCPASCCPADGGQRARGERPPMPSRIDASRPPRPTSWGLARHRRCAPLRPPPGQAGPAGHRGPDRAAAGRRRATLSEVVAQLPGRSRCGGRPTGSRRPWATRRITGRTRDLGAGGEWAMARGAPR